MNKEIFQTVIQYIPLVMLFLLLGLLLVLLIHYIYVMWSNWHSEPVEDTGMYLHVNFTDGWSMSHPVNSPYEAQKFINRLTWAGVRDAMVIVDGFIEYEVDDTGLLVYTACTS